MIFPYPVGHHIGQVHVVRNAEWTAAGAHGTALCNTFGTSGWICTNGAAAVKSYGVPAIGARGMSLHG